MSHIRMKPAGATGFRAAHTHIDRRVSTVATALIVAHTIGSNSDNNHVTTVGQVTTGATRIYLFVSYFAAGTAPVITDSLSNTWSGATLTAGAAQAARIYYCNNPSVGGAQTFTATGTGSFPTLAMIAFSTTVVSGVIDANTGTVNNGGTGLSSPGNVTPAHNNEILVTGVSWGAAGSPAATITAGYTITDQINFVSGTEGGAFAYLVQTTAAATNPQWDTKSASNTAGVIASFQV
jgi:hypothetical protein